MCIFHTYTLFISTYSSFHTLFLFFLLIRRPPKSTLFPYTTPSDLKILTSRLSLSKHLAHNLGNLLNRSSDQIGRAGQPGMPRPISYGVFSLKKKKPVATTIADIWQAPST